MQYFFSRFVEAPGLPRLPLVFISRGRTSGVNGSVATHRILPKTQRVFSSRVVRCMMGVKPIILEDKKKRRVTQRTDSGVIKCCMVSLSTDKLQQSSGYSLVK